MKIKELLNYGKKLLKDNDIEDADIISKVLLEYILNIDKTRLIIDQDINVEEYNKDRYYFSLIEIIGGTPVQYITNKQEFMKLNFYVDENVLIPQPDTETLVEKVIEIAKNINEPEILDICTGSGCIGTSISKNVIDAHITMSDISENALNIAKKNYQNNILKEDAIFIKSNMFENIQNSFDIIVTNPPYIESKIIETLPEDVKKEPHIALDGGEDGLDFYRILIKESMNYLKPQGYLCMEIGYNQKETIEELVCENGNYEEIESIKDISGNDRVIIIRKK